MDNRDFSSSALAVDTRVSAQEKMRKLKLKEKRDCLIKRHVVYLLGAFVKKILTYNFPSFVHSYTQV